MVITTLLNIILQIADIFYLFFLYLGKLAFTPLYDLIQPDFVLSVSSPFSNNSFSTPSLIGPVLSTILEEVLTFFSAENFHFFHYLLLLIAGSFVVIVLKKVALDIIGMIFL